ncbi:hypothetical protein FRC03_001376 [Tulasnella sp. 419]|nr:hypothetical protein FRC03_001376 [Tulasnella sp. 419]
MANLRCRFPIQESYSHTADTARRLRTKPLKWCTLVLPNSTQSLDIQGLPYCTQTRFPNPIVSGNSTTHIEWIFLLNSNSTCQNACPIFNIIAQSPFLERLLHILHAHVWIQDQDKRSSNPVNLQGLPLLVGTEKDPRHEPDPTVFQI